MRSSYGHPVLDSGHCNCERRALLYFPKQQEADYEKERELRRDLIFVGICGCRGYVWYNWLDSTRRGGDLGLNGSLRRCLVAVLLSLCLHTWGVRLFLVS